MSKPGGDQKRAQKRAKRAQRKKATRKPLPQSEVNKLYLKSSRRFYSQFNDDPQPKHKPGGSS